MGGRRLDSAQPDCGVAPIAKSILSNSLPDSPRNGSRLIVSLVPSFSDKGQEADSGAFTENN